MRVVLLLGLMGLVGCGGPSAESFDATFEVVDGTLMMSVEGGSQEAIGRLEYTDSEGSRQVIATGGGAQEGACCPQENRCTPGPRGVVQCAKCSICN